MIFVTVGTHDQSFDRLLSGMDDLEPTFDQEVVAQVGHSEYRPQNMEWFEFVSEAEINEFYRRASVVVGHAGAGTILTALSYENSLVLMPRRTEHGEHLDDHQLELTAALKERDGVFIAEDTESLEAGVSAGLEHVETSASSDGELVQHFAENLEDIVG